MKQLPRITAFLLSLLAVCALGLAFADHKRAGNSSTPVPSPSYFQPVADKSAVEHAPTYLKLRLLRPAGEVYGLQEMAVETDGRVRNPFDPSQMEIEVLFRSSSGEKIAIRAFWYQDYDPKTLQPRGAPGWRVRFTPTQPGEWTAQASLSGIFLQSKTMTFSVKADHQAHGFVRVNPQNPSYFGFDDGTFFFPIGLNMAWSTSHVLQDYRRWLDHLSQNGGNFIRVWMASWSFGIEWDDTGLGNYAQRLRQAWLLDQVFQMAQERGVYIMLTLLNHGAFNTQADPEWSSNPYNAALGGPCQEPQDFVTNPQAKDYFKRRLSYIAARWAYSPNLMAWEWWNEVDWTPISDASLRPWIDDMSASLETDDPYHHLISNSYTIKHLSSLWSMPELSFAQLHDYNGDDPIRTFAESFHQIARIAGEKPQMVSEYGNPSHQDDDQLGKDGLQLHNGLWAAPFSGYASTAMYWWWDSYIDRYDLWYQIKGIASFMQGENLARLPLKRGEIHLQGATALVLQNSDQVLAWIRNDYYSMPTLRFALSLASLFDLEINNWQSVLPDPQNQVLTLNDLRDGDYLASWYSPQNAQWIDQSRIRVQNGKSSLAVPEFKSDLAFKLVFLSGE